MKEIAKNKQAFFNYFISDKIESGVCLLGTEIKSIRSSSCSIMDAYIDIVNGEAWIVNMEIPHYAMGNINNHNPKRRRKLLIKKSEIRELKKAKAIQGYSIVPTRVYLKNGLCKIEIALGKGKKNIDKRDIIKTKEINKNIMRATKRKN